MNFSMNNKTFLLALESVSDVVTKGASKDYKGENLVKVICKEDKVELLANGGDISILLKITDYFDNDLIYNFEQEGEILVNIKELINALKSFFPTDVLIFSYNKNEDEENALYIENAQDKDRFQMVSIISAINITFPQKYKKYNAETTVNKDIFIKGFSTVSFAFFYMETNEKTNCFVFDSDVNKAKFITGSVSQYACDEFVGDGICNSKGFTRIVFPYFSIPILLSTLKKIPSSEISIHDNYGDNKKEVPSQIDIETEVADIVIRGKNTALQDNYSDINSFLTKEYKNSFKMKRSDLKMPMKGILATRDYQIVNNINNVDYHYVIMDIDFKKENAILSTNTKLKSKSKINIADPTNNGEFNKLTLHSKFMSDIVNNGSDVDVVTLKCDEAGGVACVSYDPYVNEAAGYSEYMQMIFSTVDD